MRFFPYWAQYPQGVTDNPTFLLTKQLREGVLCGVLPAIPRPPAMHIYKKTDKSIIN